MHEQKGLSYPKEWVRQTEQSQSSNGVDQQDLEINGLVLGSVNARNPFAV